jgi:hypothetical protein
MKAYLYCLVLTVLYACASAQSAISNCTRTVRYLSLKSKLDSSICVPKGYQIMDIINVDLDGNGYADKVVKWHKIKLSDGDTTYFSIYRGEKPSGFSLFKTLDNLSPLYFKNYEAPSGMTYYDSIKFLYYYPTLNEVNFSTGMISLKFYVDAANVRKLLFNYSQKDNTWILSREIGWLSPIQNNSSKELFDRKPNEPISIDTFDILGYSNQ